MGRERERERVWERDEGKAINRGEGKERGTLRKNMGKEGSKRGRLSCMYLWMMGEK